MFNFRRKRSESVQQLYDIFSKYAPENLECCSCCHDDAYVQMLKRKPLRSLKSGALQEYFFSALYTCGDVNAFKYFLPRLFELEDMDLDQFRAKFEYVNWKEEWPPAEIEAIENHILAEWMSGKFPHFFEEYFAFFSFENVLGYWKDNPVFLKTCVECWVEERYFFREFWSDEKTFSKANRTAIAVILKKTYLENIDTNQPYADCISQIIGWFEPTNRIPN